MLSACATEESVRQISGTDGTAAAARATSRATPQITPEITPENTIGNEETQIMDFNITYPDYNTKAFTISYDDCTVQDQKVMKLAKKYGVGVTFALNTKYWDTQGWMEHCDYEVWVERPKESEAAGIYGGFEIASHTASHPDLTQVDDITIYREVKQDMAYMEKLTGQKIRGICYPSSGYNGHVIEMLKSYGMIYGRTADSILTYELPEDFMVWKPTCHDEYTGMTQLVEQMINEQTHKLLCYYVWGHSYELDKPALTSGTTRWGNLEKLFEQVGTSDYVWCAANGQIASYVLAVRQSTMTGEYFINNSNKIIYAVDFGKKVEIAPGEKYAIEA